VAQQPVFQLRIRLEGINPPAWRRVLVPGGVRLAKLHDIFQAAMGWTNSHLHSFTIGDHLYGMQYDDYPEDELDETEHTVFIALRKSVRRFVYEYDFGDSWTHEVPGACVHEEATGPGVDAPGPVSYSCPAAQERRVRPRTRCSFGAAR